MSSIAEAAEKEKEANVEVKTVDEAFDTREKKLVEFVSRNIELMESKVLFSGSATPTFYELNKALSEHESVLLGLTTLNTRVKYAEAQAKEQFKVWFAEEKMKVKREVNREDNKKVWWSASEIEDETISRNKVLYCAMKADIAKAEAQHSFVQRLIDGWTSYQFSLSQLSKNAIAEANASGTSLSHPQEDIV